MKTREGTRGMLTGRRRRGSARALTRRALSRRRSGTTRDESVAPGPAPRRPARQRVVLRPPDASDRDELLRLARASRGLHRRWVDPPADASTFRSFLQGSRLASVRTFLVIRRADRAIVGVFTLSQIFLGNFRSAYLGYWVGAPYSGQGYMTEGMALLLRYAFGRLKLHRVEANLQPRNVASRALARRTGFRQEGFSPRYLKIGGRWRDHERWAITVEDFRSSTRRRRRPSGR